MKYLNKLTESGIVWDLEINNDFSGCLVYFYSARHLLYRLNFDHIDQLEQNIIESELIERKDLVLTEELNNRQALAKSMMANIDLMFRKNTGVGVMEHSIDALKYATLKDF